MHRRHQKNKINYTKKIRNIILILFIAFISVPISFSKYTSTINDNLSLNIRKPEYDIVYNSNYFPEGYKEVEYIESTGTQYIDTGYIPKTNTELHLTLSFSGTFSPGTLNTYIFFSAASQQDDFFGLTFGGSYYQNNTLFAWFDKSYYVTGISEQLNITDEIRTNKKTIVVKNGSIAYGGRTRTITSKSGNQSTSMILFGFSNYGNTPVPISAYNMKVYRLRLYENDVLVREYVPCYRVSDNTIGLYELVNNVFYTNNGTGTFNKGNDIVTSGTMTNQHFVYNIAQDIEDNQYSKSGYIFNGWNTKKDGTGTSYEEGQSVSKLTETDNGTVNLYGQWIFEEIEEPTVFDRTGISVGDYITYTSPTASVSLSTTETGYSSTQTLSRKDTFRVMEINEDGSMVLIGAMTSQDDKIYFTGGLGYNNEVYTLNAKCSELYKDETRGITARSMKVEDITDKFNDYANSKITDFLDYCFDELSVGNQITSLNKANRTVTYGNVNNTIITYYPDIIRYEKDCAIDNVPTQGILGQSDIYNGYNYNGKTGLTNIGMVRPYPSSLTLPYTYYVVDAEENDYTDTENAGAFYNMFFETGTTFYLASRCIGLTPAFAYFNIRTINGRSIDVSIMRISADEDYSSPTSKSVCPIVYIPANVEVNISANPKNQNNINGTAHVVK